jgi:LPS-assembly protein
MVRSSARVGWQRRDISSSGFVNQLETSMRGDLYHIANRDPTLLGAGEEEDNFDQRGFLRAHNILSLPLAKTTQYGQIVLEPSVALTVTSNIDNNKTPNEDSQDVQLDSNNLFAEDRFPGFDRVEDGARATYGLRAGYYNLENSQIEAFIGQSQLLSDSSQNPFLVGSGLTRDNSDIVASLTTRLRDRAELNYKTQFETESLRSVRHELDGMVNYGPLQYNAVYLYARGLQGTDIDFSREQIYNQLAYKFADDWRVRMGARYDLGEIKGLRYSQLGLDYLGQCLSVGGTIERNLTDTVTGEPSTEFMLRVGLKNLGEFGSGDDINNNY